LGGSLSVTFRDASNYRI
jgi:hypothetical protein